MDYDEQALIDEVMYLRSLWNFGPPRNPYTNPLTTSSTDRLPNPNPTHRFNHPPATLHFSSPSAGGFRKHSSHGTRKKIKKQRKRKRPDLPSSISNDTPWMSAELVSNTSSEAAGWPSIRPSASSAPQTLPDEELAKRAAEITQQNGLKICQGFFKSIADSDNEGICCSEDDDIDDEPHMDAENDDSSMDETVEFEKSKKFNFFLKVFTDDAQLREYYESNFDLGLFCCLVCGGTGQKVRKKFKGCVALLTHAVTITRTKNRRAHRAYGQVICKVLGWDIDRLPLIVSSGEPLSRSLGMGEVANDANGKAIQTGDFSVAVAKKWVSSVIADPKESIDCNRKDEVANAANGESIQTEDISVAEQLSDCSGMADINGGEPTQAEDSSFAVAKKCRSSSSSGSSQLMECNNEKGELGNGVDTVHTEVSSVSATIESDKPPNGEINELKESNSAQEQGVFVENMENDFEGISSRVIGAEGVAHCLNQSPSKTDLPQNSKEKNP